MPTVTLTDSGFSFDLANKTPKGHLKVSASDGGVQFVLDSTWTGDNPATVDLPTNIFQNGTVSVGSTATTAPLAATPSGQGFIKTKKPKSPGLDTMQGQIDVVPKGGGEEDPK